jgi:hypothetical protein
MGQSLSISVTPKITSRKTAMALNTRVIAGRLSLALSVSKTTEKRRLRGWRCHLCSVSGGNQHVKRSSANPPKTASNDMMTPSSGCVEIARLRSDYISAPEVGADPHFGVLSYPEARCRITI